MSESRLSVQLYTVREAIEADLADAVARVAEIGFRQVEPYNFTARAEEYRAAFASTGITAPSAHSKLIGEDVRPIFEAAVSLGITTIIDPHSGQERWATRESIEQVADDLNALVGLATEFGLTLGYHNHAYELESVIDGTPGLEIFAARLDPAIVLEIDTYWVAVGGQDVVALLGRLGDRVQLLHIKDGPLTKEDKNQVAVGSGSMPVADIVAAAPEGALLVVELDDFDGDVFTALADSHAWLTAQGIR